MILYLAESSTPKRIPSELRRFISHPALLRPPWPHLGKEVTREDAPDGVHVNFMVLNQTPLPFPYSISVRAIDEEGLVDYAHEFNFMFMFSRDDWRLTLDDSPTRRQVEIRLGLQPIEVCLDRLLLVV